MARKPLVFDGVELPPLPERFWTPLGEVRVRVLREVPTTKADEVLYGSWEQDSRTINIRDGMHPSTTWYTFHHEDMHRILDDTGVQLDKDTEEAVCNAYALMRTLEMIDQARRSATPSAA